MIARAVESPLTDPPRDRPPPTVTAPTAAAKAAREARLADALRRNLKGRKAQARARDAAAGSDPDTGGKA